MEILAHFFNQQKQSLEGAVQAAQTNLDLKEKELGFTHATEVAGVSYFQVLENIVNIRKEDISLADRAQKIALETAKLSKQQLAALGTGLTDSEAIATRLANKRRTPGELDNLVSEGGGAEKIKHFCRSDKKESRRVSCL